MHGILEQRLIAVVIVICLTLIGMRLVFTTPRVVTAMPVNPQRHLPIPVAILVNPQGRISTRPAVTLVPVPTSTPVPVQTDMITVRYSRYDPALGGPNCSRFVNGVCISNMASGHPWVPYMESACACVPEWPFGTVVILDGKEWTCMDRGGKIQIVNGIPWVDFLTRSPGYSYRELVQVQVVFQ